MNEYIKLQLWKALKTLPWYAAIPALPVAAIFLFFRLIGWGNSNDIIQFSKVAALIGVFVWIIRQCVRLLWTIRVVTRPVE